VNQVKGLQRSSASVNRAWWAHCDLHLGGTRDPARHDVRALTEFIATVPPPLQGAGRRERRSRSAFRGPTAGDTRARSASSRSSVMSGRAGRRGRPRRQRLSGSHQLPQRRGRSGHSSEDTESSELRAPARTGRTLTPAPRRTRRVVPAGPGPPADEHTGDGYMAVTDILVRGSLLPALRPGDPRGSASYSADDGPLLLLVWPCRLRGRQLRVDLRVQGIHVQATGHRPAYSQRWRHPNLKVDQERAYWQLEDQHLVVEVHLIPFEIANGGVSCPGLPTALHKLMHPWSTEVRDIPEEDGGHP